MLIADCTHMVGGRVQRAWLAGVSKGHRTASHKPQPLRLTDFEDAAILLAQAVTIYRHVLRQQLRQRAEEGEGPGTCTRGGEEEVDSRLRSFGCFCKPQAKRLDEQ